MKNKNLFELNANFSDDWTSDNREKPKKKLSTEIKEPNKHQLHFAKEKRRGKVVTIVKPFHLSANDLKALLKTLKKSLGTGGTVKEDALEFQGEIKEKLHLLLMDLGYKIKGS
jgi:translation initiation factor 1